MRGLPLPVDFGVSRACSFLHGLILGSKVGAVHANGAEKGKGAEMKVAGHTCPSWR